MMDQPDMEPAVARVISGSALEAILRAARGTNAERDLMSGAPTRVAILHECDRQPSGAEMHAHADDIFYVLEGSAVVTLGGELVEPVEASPGEWRGKGITEGRETVVNTGDIILIPRGTPHSRHTAGRTAALLLVKVTA